MREERKYCHKSINVTMKEPIYKVSCIVIGSKCTVMRSTSHVALINPVVKLLSKRRWIPVGARLEGPKLESEGPRAEVGFPTADQGFSSIQGTLFGF